MASSSAGDVHIRVCTICEAMCSLEVHHDGTKVTAIRGDEASHFSRGHICPKGNALQDIHDDPERLRTPKRRGPDGTWEDVAWDEALDDIAARLLAIQAQHGRDAVGLYVGNPTAHHLGPLIMLYPFAAALGTKNRFSASSLDQLPHMVAAWKLFGSIGMLPTPDIDRTDHFLCLGGNPLASNGSLMSTGGFRYRLRDLQARGGRFVVVDPRRTESARAADEHHFIRPGTDAWLLLAMLGVIFDEGLDNAGHLGEFTDGIGRLRDLVAAVTPQDAAAVTGIDADAIYRLARDFANAPRALAYGRMGVCTQEFGGLTAWLLYALNIVTGNLDRPGGMMFTRPAVDPLPLAHIAGVDGGMARWSSRVSGLPEFAGELPAVAMAEEVDTPGDGQIRALVVHAGNPVLSTPNGSRLERGLENLDFMVCFDQYVTETSRHADYILPPQSPLESEEYDVALNLLATRNHAQYSEPLFDPPAGALTDFEALAGLTTRLMIGRGGRDGVRGRILKAVLGRLGASGILDLGLRTGPYGHPAAAWQLIGRGPLKALGLKLPPSARIDLEKLPPDVPRTGLTLAELKNHPHGIDLGALQSRLPERLFTDDGRITLVHDLYVQDVERLKASRDAPAGGLVLIGRRHLRSNNSWMHNSRRLVKGKDRCTLLIHPDDAAARDLQDGALATVRSRVGEVTITVEVSDTMMPGVVSIPHGWGHHREGTGWSTAEAHAGVSANDVTDNAFVDALTGNAALNGVPVEVLAAPVRDEAAATAGAAA